MNRNSFILVVASLLILLAGFYYGIFSQRIPIFRYGGTVQNTQQNYVPEEQGIINIVKNSLPSVVTIGINQVGSSQPMLPFLPSPTGQSIQNIGSGFIVSSDGLIITNRHVVSDSSASYKVTTNDNKTYDVTKIYRDPLNDLAILKIDENNLKPLNLGDSSNLQLGQLAIAIGTPLGQFRNTVTTGIVSGLGRGITAGSPYQSSVEQLNNVIQTDAPISPGNSGGPLLDSSGNVIGVNTAVSVSGTSIGFAIQSNVVKDLLSVFKSTGENFQQPFLGVRYVMIDQNEASGMNLVPGAYIVDVVSGSPADKAGLKTGDVITRFADKQLDNVSNQDLALLVLQQKIGSSVPVTVWRNGQTLNLQVTLSAAK